jgi:hypothetical protein
MGANTAHASKIIEKEPICFMKKRIKLDRGWRLRQKGSEAWLDIPVMPRQVHEVLRAHGRIGEDFDIGLGDGCKWVSETDWIYQCVFPVSDYSPKMYLHFLCLDTLSEIRLNGERIAVSRSLYLPVRVDVTKMLKKENLLEVHFESPYRFLREHPLPDEWQGKVMHCKLIRKPTIDFSDYLGAKPYITPIGVADDIFLEAADRSEIVQCDVCARLSEDLRTGTVAVSVLASACDGLGGHAVLRDPQGKEIARRALVFDGAAGECGACEITARLPELWQPRGLGRQPMYSVEVALTCGMEIMDLHTKPIGFRTLATNKDFDLRVNGAKLRLWGANIPPIYGPSHRWQPERAKTLLDLAELANMNALRVWGDGEPLNDEFYSACDKRGILVWQEFFHGYGMQPDAPDYVELCLNEGEHLVNRLKHHPSVFMWCGGNEGIMGAEFDFPGEPPIGKDIYVKGYADLCARLDPDRYYHCNSPGGGAYSNDPKAGDTHGYEMWWYSPGADYPVAFSEHMRVSPCNLKSLKRFIKPRELWPDGYMDSNTYGKRDRELMPPAWMARAGGMMAKKCGPIELFRDADSADELIYKFAAAHAKSFKRGIERCRMGRPSGAQCERISNCHMIWKLSDTWPLIYSAIVDFYLEPNMPFYAAKRGYSPILACFDIRDSISLWLVNDSGQDISGTLVFGIFRLSTETITAQRQIDVKMLAGCSGEVADLDFCKSFQTEHVLFARYEDSASGAVYANTDYVDIERRLQFPEANISMESVGGELHICSDTFAHWVELCGDDNGDDFGWIFEDNYFDLMPGSAKTVKILGRHNQGIITAKAHYSKTRTAIGWKREG